MEKQTSPIVSQILLKIENMIKTLEGMKPTLKERQAQSPITTSQSDQLQSSYLESPTITHVTGHSGHSESEEPSEDDGGASSKVLPGASNVVIDDKIEIVKVCKEVEPSIGRVLPELQPTALTNISDSYYLLDNKVSHVGVNGGGSGEIQFCVDSNMLVRCPSAVCENVSLCLPSFLAEIMKLVRSWCPIRRLRSAPTYVKPPGEPPDESFNTLQVMGTHIIFKRLGIPYKYVILYSFNGVLGGRLAYIYVVVNKYGSGYYEISHLILVGVFIDLSVQWNVVKQADATQQYRKLRLQRNNQVCPSLNQSFDTFPNVLNLPLTSTVFHHGNIRGIIFSIHGLLYGLSVLEIYSHIIIAEGLIVADYAMDIKLDSTVLFQPGSMARHGDVGFKGFAEFLFYNELTKLAHDIVIIKGVAEGTSPLNFSVTFDTGWGKPCKSSLTVKPWLQTCLAQDPGTSEVCLDQSKLQDCIYKPSCVNFCCSNNWFLTSSPLPIEWNGSLFRLVYDEFSNILFNSVMMRCLLASFSSATDGCCVEPPMFKASSTGMLGLNLYINTTIEFMVALQRRKVVHAATICVESMIAEFPPLETPAPPAQELPNQAEKHNIAKLLSKDKLRLLSNSKRESRDLKVKFAKDLETVRGVMKKVGIEKEVIPQISSSVVSLTPSVYTQRLQGMRPLNQLSVGIMGNSFGMIEITEKRTVKEEGHVSWIHGLHSLCSPTRQKRLLVTYRTTLFSWTNATTDWELDKMGHMDICGTKIIVLYSLYIDHISLSGLIDDFIQRDIPLKQLLSPLLHALCIPVSSGKNSSYKKHKVLFRVSEGLAARNRQIDNDLEVVKAITVAGAATAHHDDEVALVVGGERIFGGGFSAATDRQDRPSEDYSETLSNYEKPISAKVVIVLASMLTQSNTHVILIINIWPTTLTGARRVQTLRFCVEISTVSESDVTPTKGIKSLLHFAKERTILGRPIYQAASNNRDKAGLTMKLRNNSAALFAWCWYWPSNGVEWKDIIVLPYKDNLLVCSMHQQQVVVEVIGKDCVLDGKMVPQGLMVYGNKGSTYQHAYIQRLKGDSGTWTLAWIFYSISMHRYEFLLFSLPRPPEVDDLEDKVDFKGRGMMRINNMGLWAD